jgi:hypothetical protein
MTSGPYAPPAQTPQRRSGCLLALYIMLGLGTLVIVASLIAGWLFMRSERGQKVIKAVSESMAMAKQAMQAPGTDELRKAGCTQAMVIPTSQILKIVSEVAPEAQKDMPESVAGDTLIMCQINSDTKGPDCPAVAQIYAKAVPDSPESFGITVQRQGQTTCQGTYARDGTFLDSFDQK